MALQSLPRSAEVYGRDQRAEIGAAVSAVRRQWRRMAEGAAVRTGDLLDLDASYSNIEPRVLAVLDTAQERVAEGAVAYIPAVLAETRQPVRSAEYDVAPWRLVGTSGDGWGTDSLAYGAVTHAKSAIGQGASLAEALAQGGRYLTTATGTMLSDTGRTAEKMAGASRGTTLWVRMLEPPSCGRCIILAGKETRNAEAFDRHPKCDCRNIPTSENIAGSFTTDPHEYLDNLSDRELARALGSKANAQAWRDGADRNQLINAYRVGGDVRPAQIFNRSIKYTTEGVTRRGQAYRSMGRMRANQVVTEQAGFATRVTRTGPEARAINQTRRRTERLMPETIYQIAKDGADARRLLRLYGWIF